MASKLNIKLLHLELTDTQARIVSLLVYGLEYDETGRFLGIVSQTIHNSISSICGKLELQGVFHLLAIARENGFDTQGNCDTIALFTPLELSMLFKRFPSSRRKKKAPAAVP